MTEQADVIDTKTALILQGYLGPHAQRLLQEAAENGVVIPEQATRKHQEMPAFVATTMEALGDMGLVQGRRVFAGKAVGDGSHVMANKYEMTDEAQEVYDALN